MLPSLRAQETLRMITAMSIGSGSVKPSVASRVHRDLERTANSGRAKPPAMGGVQSVRISELKENEARAALALDGLTYEAVKVTK